MADGLLDTGELLDEAGELAQSGYAFSQTKRYDRGAVRSSALRIKEWDRYCFCDEEFAVELCVADNSYVSIGSVSVTDFKHLKHTTKRKIGFLPRGKLHMPTDCSNGDVRFEKGGVRLEFGIEKSGERTLFAECDKFDGKRKLVCELTLEANTSDSITVATGLGKKRRFYYDTKINCLKGSGRFSIGDDRHVFDAGYGGLDWCRSVWQYKSAWHAASLSCEIDGKPFGLNLETGIGKPQADENVILYAGKASKLGRVRFDIPYTQGRVDYLKPWRIYDDPALLDIMFYPMINRNDRTNVLVIATDLHRVFGRFYGKATLSDGTIVTLADKIGYAERVKNRW